MDARAEEAASPTGGSTSSGGTESTGGVPVLPGTGGEGPAGTGGTGPSGTGGTGGISYVSPDGSDCGPPIEAFCDADCLTRNAGDPNQHRICCEHSCAPGCIRMFGTTHDSGCWSGATVAACVRSCEDDSNQTVPTLLPDGNCWWLARSCADWSADPAPCASLDRNCSGATIGGYTVLRMAPDGGDPCALESYLAPDGHVMAPGSVEIRSGFGGSYRLLERASVQDCGAREGYYLDQSAGTPRIVLCPVTCTAVTGPSDAGAWSVVVSPW